MRAETFDLQHECIRISTSYGQSDAHHQYNKHILKIPKAHWPKEKVQKDKQRSTKHTHKTKDRVTRIPLKTGGEPKCSERVEFLLN